MMRNEIWKRVIKKTTNFDENQKRNQTDALRCFDAL